jgi:ketosteroid isomerase-like protein
MKNITFFIAVILILSAVSIYFSTKYFSMKQNNRSGVVSTETKEEIQKVMDDQILAWNSGSHEGFMNGYYKSDSLRFISENGVKYGWNTLLEAYKSSFDTKEKMGTLVFHLDDVTSISNDGNTVLVIGRWEIEGENGKSGIFTVIFRNINGEWKIVVDHTF